MKTALDSSPRGLARKGFTLIEMLVVIAIIALLAAILFPVFGTVREKARQTTCLSNEKQLGLGFIQYNQDNDERYPTDYSFEVPAPPVASWDVGIEPYLGQAITYGTKGNPLVLICPDDTIPGASGDARRTYSMPQSQANPFIGPSLSVIGGHVVSLGRPVSQITTPAGVILLAEQPTAGNVLGGPNAAYVNCASGCAPASQAQDNDYVTPAYHSGGWNYLFADGHAKWMRPEQTIGKGTMAAPQGMWLITSNTG